MRPVMQANRSGKTGLNFKGKPITHSMGWGRFLSYPVCLTACVRQHIGPAAAVPGNGFEEETLAK